MNWQLAILLPLFFGAGTAILVGAVAALARNLRFVWGGFRTVGVIVKAEQGQRRQATVERRRAEGRHVHELEQRYVVSPAQLVWTLTVEYQDATGTRQQATVDAGTRKQRYTSGERVPLFYRLRAPSEVRIASCAELWGWPLLGVLLGATFVVFGAILVSDALRAD